MVAAADGSLTGQTPGGDTLRVREVWQDNLEAEMKVDAGQGLCCGRAGHGQVAFGLPSRRWCMLLPASSLPWAGLLPGSSSHV